MNIPEPFKSIIENNFKKINYSLDTWTKDFIDLCFSDLITQLNISDYQARASKTGKMFEYIFWFLMKEKFDIELGADYIIPKACMEGGGALDFGIMRNDKILCGIEAKGSASEVKNEDGEIETLSRPALKRTDTVKKAISQAYQFKRIFPETQFYLVTNVKPTSGNAKCMLDLAEGDIIDKVVDITNNEELEDFAKILKEI